MSWSIDPKKVGSINDGGRRLPAGKANYKIVEAKTVTDKQDATGRTKQVSITFERAGLTYTQFFSPMSDNQVQAEIAQKTLVAIFAAAGIKGILKPEKLASLKGKVVELEVTDTAGKGANKDKSYSNIRTAEAPSTEDDDEDDDDEEEEDEEDDEEEDEEDDDAPPAKPVKAAKSKKPPVEEEEEEDDEEEEEEDDDEDDTPPAKPAKSGKAKKSKPWG